LAASIFKEINEAYSVLSDKKKRKAYNENEYAYLKKNSATTAILAEHIYLQSLDLYKTILNADPFRLNTDALHYRVLQLLQPVHIKILQSGNDLATNNTLIKQVLFSCRFFTKHELEPVLQSLNELAKENDEGRWLIVRFLKQQRIAAWWDKYKIAVAIIITVALCAFLFMIIK
jgi:curved DNA-binding protein CbpA